MENTDASRIEDVPVLETWKRLEGDPKAVLVDVRTRAEWAFVGIPDLSRLDREVLLMEWQTFPDNRIDPDFAGATWSRRSTASGCEKDAPSFSSSAARAAAAGWLQKPWRRRDIAIAGMWRKASRGLSMPTVIEGRIAGWKFAGSPWVQG